MLGLLLLIGLPSVSIGLGVATLLTQLKVLRRLNAMSENLDTELTDIDAAVVALTNAVATASADLSDLASKLNAALAQLQQQGLTPAQLAHFDSIKSQLASITSNLSAAAGAADPPAPPAETTSAPAGDNTVSGATGGDSTSGTA